MHTGSKERHVEDVHYYSEGEKVSAQFYPPVDVDDPAPAIVFCPGYTGTKYTAFYQPFIERITQAGIGVLLIDYRGWGDSEGTRGMILPLAQVADVRAGLSYLETRDEVDGNHLGVFGVSFGGGIATYVAGVDDRVKSGVSVSGIADGEDWMRFMRRGYEWRELTDQLAEDRRQAAITGSSRIVDPVEDIMIPTPERRATSVKGDIPPDKLPRETELRCAQAIIEFRPIDVVERISPRAMYWTCVEDDVVVPAEHSRSMYARASEPKKLWVMPGRAHYDAYVEHRDELMNTTIAWYAQHL